MRLTVVVEDNIIIIDRAQIEFEALPDSIPSEVRAFQWFGTNGHIEYHDLTPETEVDTLPSWAQDCVSLHEAKVAEIAANELPLTPEEVVRSQRTQLLHQTDWWAVSDRVMSPEEITYRQALRDITEQTGFPHNVVWPVKP